MAADEMKTGSKHTPGYEADAEGNIWSVSSNWRGYGRRRLVPTFNGHGYLKVRLTMSGRRINRTVHVLVAEQFLPPRPSPKHEVRHLDGDRTNNRSSNLAWGTRKENAEDREKHGRTSRGVKHSAAIKVGLEGRNVRT